MSIVTKKQFADLVGMASNKLSVYIGRGKVFVGENDMINTGHEVNVAFYQKYKKKALAEVKTSDEDAQAGPMQVDIPGLGTVNVPEYADSERVLKYLDTLKRDKEVKHLELKEAKIRGEVVPSGVVGQIILQHNHSILTRFKETMEELIRKMAKQYDISGADVATYKGEMVTYLNTSILSAAEMTAGSVENLIKEYSNSRGVGERA